MWLFISYYVKVNESKSGIGIFYDQFFSAANKTLIIYFYFNCYKRKYNACTINPAIIYGDIFKGKGGVFSDCAQKGTDLFFQNGIK